LSKVISNFLNRLCEYTEVLKIYLGSTPGVQYIIILRLGRWRDIL